MDDSFKHAGDAMTAMVVRQYTPARIERALLAQVFELVWGQQTEPEESWTTQDTNRTDWPSAVQPASEPHVVGRRAA